MQTATGTKIVLVFELTQPGKENTEREKNAELASPRTRCARTECYELGYFSWNWPSECAMAIKLEPLALPYEAHLVASGATGDILSIMLCEERKMAFTAKIEPFLDNRPFIRLPFAYFLPAPQKGKHNYPQKDVYCKRTVV